MYGHSQKLHQKKEWLIRLFSRQKSLSRFHGGVWAEEVLSKECKRQRVLGLRAHPGFTISLSPPPPVCLPAQWDSPVLTQWALPTCCIRKKGAYLRTDLHRELLFEESSSHRLLSHAVLKRIQVLVISSPKSSEDLDLAGYSACSKLGYHTAGSSPSEQKL